MIPLAIYLLLGTGAAWWFDRDQMKHEVPYGDWPSIVSLQKLRIVCLVLNVLFGPLWVIRAGISSLRSWIRVKLAFYRLKKISKKASSPRLYELVVELEKAFYASREDR